MRYYLMNSRFLLAVLVLWLVGAVPARAGIIISVGSTTTAPGGIGIVNFYITSDNPNGDQLGSFQIQLQASEVSGADGLNLSFTANQPTVYDQSNYVFSGNSGFQDSSTLFWGTPFSTVTANDTIVGGDFNDSAQGYTMILPGTTYLLASVQVDPSQANDVFSITLVPSSGSGNGQTYFDDPNGNGIQYSSTPGTVTTVTATPEPSSLVLTGIGSLCGLLYSWRSRRQARPRSSEPGMTSPDSQA